MRKFIAIMLLVAISFGGGYYLGQRPVGTLRHTVSDLSKRLEGSEEIVGDLKKSLKTLSQTALDTTLGIERDLRRRQRLVEAKSRLVQAKAHVINRNFGDAARELAEAVAALEAPAKAIKQDPAADAMLDLAGSLKEVRLEVARGKSVSLKTMDEMQRKLDQMLDK